MGFLFLFLKSIKFISQMQHKCKSAAHNTLLDPDYLDRNISIHKHDLVQNIHSAKLFFCRLSDIDLSNLTSTSEYIINFQQKNFTNTCDIILTICKSWKVLLPSRESYKFLLLFLFQVYLEFHLSSQKYFLIWIIENANVVIFFSFEINVIS